MRKQNTVLFVLLLFPLIFVGLSVEQVHAAKKDESLRRGETRATLDPNMFSDPATRQAYQIARDIPWVLDSIYCYCHCEESAGHKSLLSCYVDTHAAM
jgi:hypothetical protein